MSRSFEIKKIVLVETHHDREFSRGDVNYSWETGKIKTTYDQLVRMLGEPERLENRIRWRICVNEDGTDERFAEIKNTPPDKPEECTKWIVRSRSILIFMLVEELVRSASAIDQVSP